MSQKHFKQKNLDSPLLEYLQCHSIYLSGYWDKADMLNLNKTIQSYLQTILTIRQS